MGCERARHSGCDMLAQFPSLHRFFPVRSGAKPLGTRLLSTLRLSKSSLVTACRHGAMSNTLLRLRRHMRNRTPRVDMLREIFFEVVTMNRQKMTFYFV